MPSPQNPETPPFRLPAISGTFVDIPLANVSSALTSTPWMRPIGTGEVSSLSSVMMSEARRPVICRVSRVAVGYVVTYENAWSDSCVNQQSRHPVKLTARVVLFAVSNLVVSDSSKAYPLTDESAFETQVRHPVVAIATKPTLVAAEISSELCTGPGTHRHSHKVTLK